MGSYNAFIAFDIHTSTLPYQEAHDTTIAKNSVGFKVVESCNQ